MVHIITQYYKVGYGDNENRQKELDKCIINNINNISVDKIHILYNNDEDKKMLDNLIKNPKIIYKQIYNIIRYSDVFEYYNSFLFNKTCVYLHADMYIGNGFEDESNFKQNVIYFLIPHKVGCDFNINCKCSRKTKTDKGLFSSGAFDGFVFKNII